jgi:hypothetical protein
MMGPKYAKSDFKFMTEATKSKNGIDNVNTAAIARILNAIFL